MAILSFLHKFTEMLEEYFAVLAEESIKDNFVLIYELLDEIMDFGYPQVTESQVLKSYIFQSGQKLQLVKPPPAVTNAVSWRREGIYYRSNTAHLDVTEKVNLLVNSQGTIISHDINGTVVLNSNLSGMPEVRMGFNDQKVMESRGGHQQSVDLEDLRFHQCVRLGNFEQERTISFIPPDGKFEVMNYRVSSPSRPPLWLTTSVKRKPGHSISFSVSLKSNYNRSVVATLIHVLLPVPSDCFAPTHSATCGNSKYMPDENLIRWVLKFFPGHKEAVLHANVSLPSISADDPEALKTAIGVEFEIPSHCVSGLKIRYLKTMEKSNYTSHSWIRYVSCHGVYEFRT